MKITGRRCTAAQFTASYHSPCEVEPSPMVVSTTASSPRILIPSPMPEAWQLWGGTGAPSCTGGGGVRGALPLPVQPPGALVQPARQHHVPVHFQQGLLAQLDL